MNSTPHAMKLEEAKIVVQKEVSPQDDETPSDDIELEEEIEEINEDNF